MEKVAILLVMLISSAFSTPLVTFTKQSSTTESLVISSSENPALSSSTANAAIVSSSTDAQKEKNTPQNTNDDSTPSVPKIYEMSVNTNVSNRFASTLITSKVRNLDKKAQEARFSVVLPDTAYITGFVMEIGGKSYQAYLKAKEEAKQIYQTAIDAGLAAGHVSVNARDSNRFSVNVNVEPQSKAVFKLTYEELLQRKNDQYELVINIHPGQPVNNLDVQVNINETRPLKFVKTPSLRTGNEVTKNSDKAEPSADITRVDPATAVVKFSPNVEKQKQFASALGTEQENGLSGQFVVQYDVERDPQGGEVLVKDGYFVHFFAPSDLKPLPKLIVFVLDTSGSMLGVRITQLKEAMRSILSELQPEDYFNIIDFDSNARAWDIGNQSVAFKTNTDDYDPYSYSSDVITVPTTKRPATENQFPPAFEADDLNKQRGIDVVNKLEAYGGTDILSALQTGIKQVNHFQKTHNNTHQPLLVFLTDGEATTGETDPNTICSGVTKANTEKIPIFSLSLGDDADRSLLQKISLQNYGFSRRIYEAADASLQLNDFYRDIASPLLNNVTFKYVSNVTEVSKTDFPLVFKGSELVVVGLFDGSGTFEPPQVQAHGVAGPIDFRPLKIERPVGSLERLWAYLTVKQILEARDAADNKKPYEAKALDLALKYSFVTPVSSLVVVKPNNTEDSVKPEDAASSDNRPTQYSFAKSKFISGGVIAAGYPGMGGPAGLYSSYVPAPAVPFPPAFAPLFHPSYDNTPHDLTISQNSYQDRVDSESLLDHQESVKHLYSTTVKIPTSTVVANVAEAHLSEKLPWINDILSGDNNNTIVLSTGNYTLGVNATATYVSAECKINNGTDTGRCTYLELCPQVFTTLVDVKTYEEYFCSMDEYAGVCCPQIHKGTLPTPLGTP